MRRRHVLAAAATLPLSGCASAVEAAFGEGEPREVSIDGELSPPLAEITARADGHDLGYYILRVTVTEDAGRTKVEASHSGLSDESVEDVIPADESAVELDVNSRGQYELSAVSDEAGSTTVGVKIADDGEKGPFGLFGEEN